MIYFVRHGDDGPIKIGYIYRDLDERRRRAAHRRRGIVENDLPALSRLVDERVRALQIGNPVRLTCIATMNGGHDREQRLQKAFRAAHIRGEWYSPTKRLLDFIAALPVIANGRARATVFGEARTTWDATTEIVQQNHNNLI